MPQRWEQERLASLADLALEATVVGSFSRLGYLARRRLFGWGDPAADAARAGRRGNALVTGGSSGIGLAAAEALAGAGWSVTILSRDVGRSEAALEQLNVAARRAEGSESGSGPAVLRARTADLSDLAEARRIAATIAEENETLDVVVHAAGAVFRRFHRDDQGFESTFVLHVLAPHLLTTLLLPLLERPSAPGRSARVITVSSGGMYAARFDLGALEHATPARYRGVVQYALAKRAQVELTVEWAERLAGRGVAPFAMHPGWVDTALITSGLPRFAGLARPLLRRPAEGADTVVDLALAPGVEAHAGAFFFDRRPRTRSVLPGTAPTSSQRRRAFDRVGELAGAPPVPAPAPERR